LNQKKVKRLRSIAYDRSNKKEPTQYRKVIRKKNGEYIDTGAVRCKGPREIYLNMKKKYKEERHAL